MSSPIRNPDYINATWAFYRYAPSLAAAIAFCILFFIATVIHIIQLWRTKTKYMLVFVAGGIFEVIGYIGRAKSATQAAGYWTLFPFVLQNFFLLVAPALFAASIYMTLGRIIQLTNGEPYCWIPRRWITRIFVAGDIIAFMLQGMGGGVMAGGASNYALVAIGENIVITGLALQAAWFGLFVVVTARFHARLASSATPPSQAQAQAQSQAQAQAESLKPEMIRWRTYLRTLYVVSALITVRSIIRVVEYAQGNAGYLLRHEAFLYVFDAVPMLVVVLYMSWQHPSEIALLLRGEEVNKNGLLLLRP